MVDTSELDSFVSRLESAAPQIKPKLAKILDNAGERFLRLVQEQIEAGGNVATRTRLSSFSKGVGNGIYRLNAGGLSLEIGTRVEYARWVNDGHSQQPGRFIPGVWSGDRFIYTPGADSGMVRKAAFVEGSHFFDHAEAAFEAMFPDLVKEDVRALLSQIF